MELIPILSTIILVATISTFLLAIGAYILYKVRERKGAVAYARPPGTVQAEIISPEEVWRREKIVPRPVEQEKVYEETSVKTSQTENVPRTERFVRETKIDEPEKKVSETKYMKYTSEGYVQPKEDRSAGALRWR